MYHIVFRRLRLFYARNISENSPFYNGTEILFRPAHATFSAACTHLLHLNPISGRLLATPISGRGGGCLGPPLDISGSYRSIFKIQTAFVSPQHDLHF